MRLRKPLTSPEIKATPPLPDIPVIRVRILWDEREHVIDLSKQLDLSRVQESPDDLNRALSENPMRYAWWASLEADARGLEEMLEGQLEDHKASVYSGIEMTLRAESPDKSPKPPTVDAIKARMRLDPEYRRLTEEIVKVRTQRRHVEAARKSMEQRKDSLLEIARNMRAEMEGRLTVRKRPDDELQQQQAAERARFARPGALRPSQGD